MEILNYGDLADYKPLDGEKLKLQDVVGKPIIVTNHRITKSKYSSRGTEYCTTIQFYFEDDETQKMYVIFTGSNVLKDQIASIEDKIVEGQAFKTVIQTIGNYHSFT